MCGAQEVYYTQNNRNEFNFVETWIMFLGAQEPQSNNTKSDEFTNPTFFLETPCIYISNICVITLCSTLLWFIMWQNKVWPKSPVCMRCIPYFRKKHLYLWWSKLNKILALGWRKWCTNLKCAEAVTLQLNGGSWGISKN